MKGHVRAGLAQAHSTAIPLGLHGQVHLAFSPICAQFIQCNGHRAESGGWLALKETKTFGQFVRYQVAQAPVVGQHDQADSFKRLVGCTSHRHIAGDDGHFAFKVDTPGFVGKRYLLAGAQKVVAAALVHQGFGVVIGRYFRMTGQADQFHMIDIGRAVGPLVGARQRGQTHGRVKREGVAGFTRARGAITSPV